MRTQEQHEKAQEEMRARFATGRKKKKKRPSVRETERKIRKRRLRHRKAYHAKKKLLRLAGREVAAKVRAEKLAAKAERRLLWEQKKAKREAKKTAMRDPMKKLSKTDAAYYRGWQDAMRVAAQSPCPVCGRGRNSVTPAMGKRELPIRVS